MADRFAGVERDGLDGSDSSIRFAGGVLRHSPWFHARDGGAAAAAGAEAVRGSRTETGEMDDLAGLTRAAVTLAGREPLPAGTVGALRLVLEPQWTTLRVFAGGAWRDGFRGLVFANLHGLFRLIVLARAWLARSARPEASAR